MVAAKIRDHFAEEAKKRQAEHGGTAPGRKKNTSGQKAHSVERDLQSRASEQAGLALNVSRQSVDRARVVLEKGTPEVIKDVEEARVITRVDSKIREFLAKIRAYSQPLAKVLEV